MNDIVRGVEGSISINGEDTVYKYNDDQLIKVGNTEPLVSQLDNGSVIYSRTYGYLTNEGQDNYHLSYVEEYVEDITNNFIFENNNVLNIGKATYNLTDFSINLNANFDTESNKIVCEQSNIQYQKYLDDYLFGTTFSKNDFDKSTMVKNGVLTIPSFVENEKIFLLKKFLEIAEDTFDNYSEKENITKIILPNDLKIIRKNAFKNFINAEIVLPQSIVYIDDSAFKNVKKIYYKTTAILGIDPNNWGAKEGVEINE